MAGSRHGMCELMRQGYDVYVWISLHTPFLCRKEGLQENSKGEHQELETVAHADLPNRQHLHEQYCQSCHRHFEINRQSSPSAQRWALFSAVSVHKELEVMTLILQYWRHRPLRIPKRKLWACTVHATYGSRHCIRLPKQAPHDNTRHKNSCLPSPLPPFWWCYKIRRLNIGLTKHMNTNALSFPRLPGSCIRTRSFIPADYGNTGPRNE
jgi:hypothetical protein